MADVDFKFVKWSEELIPGLIRNADNPKVSENLRNIFPCPYTADDAHIWIELCGKNDERRDYNRAIVIDGEAAGGIGLNVQPDVYCRSAELGYWLGEDYWGRGIMSRAVREICEYGFENLDIVRIFAGAFARNTGSRRVLEKAGFEFEGTMRSSVFKNGEIIDSCMYALLK